jgi:hypothetical protein
MLLEINGEKFYLLTFFSTLIISARVQASTSFDQLRKVSLRFPHTFKLTKILFWFCEINQE